MIHSIHLIVNNCEAIGVYPIGGQRGGERVENALRDRRVAQNERRVALQRDLEREQTSVQRLPLRCRLVSSSIFSTSWIQVFDGYSC